MALWPALLGVNLWLLSTAVPLLGGPRPALHPAHLLLLLAPALLAVGLRRQARPLTSVLLLCGVPLCALLPGPLGLLGDPTLGAIPRAAVALQGAVLLGYLGVTARLLGAAADGPSAPPSAPLRSVALAAPPMPRRWRRRFAVYRGLLLISAGLPLTLLYALDFHAPTLRALRLSFNDLARQHAFQATAAAALCLMWVFVYQMCFLLPLRVHLDHDRDTVAQIDRLRHAARRGRPRPQFYVAMLLALGSMILLIWRSLHP